MDEVLLQKLADGVLTLTLNRPAQRNALTWDLMHRLVEALRDAAVNPGVRVVVLTGAATSFCSGGDLRSGEEYAPDDAIAAQWRNEPIWRSLEQRSAIVQRYTMAAVLLHTMPKPTLAMVRGAAAGAGLCLAAACDLRVASDTAFFTTVFGAAARSGDYGGSYFLTHLLGSAKARELYLLGGKVDAQEALRLGLVTRVVADADLETEAHALASRLAHGPTVAYGYMKKNINAAETSSLQEVIELEILHMLRCSQSEDGKEAGRAFREQRDPVYRGY
jgi:2-(1,2-epoxy-1,2-dihydrophenyl)acetyl-CoA isomerase